MMSVEHAREVKAKYEPILLRMPNVISVGVGLSPAPASPSPANATPPALTPDQLPRHPVLVVCVRRTGALELDRDAGGIPDEIEGVPVTIQVTGEFHAL